MSTADPGGAGVASQALADAKQLFEQAQQEEQLDLLEPVSPEEMLDAREELGPNAGNVAVLKHARERKRGRPKNARNRRTDDFAKYILGFGQDPAITLIQIASTPPEVLIENSRRLRRKRRTKSGLEVDVMQTMSYEAAQSLRVRCAEALMAYTHSKKPVTIDGTIRGVRVIEEVAAAPANDIVEGDFVRVERPEEASR